MYGKRAVFRVHGKTEAAPWWQQPGTLNSFHHHSLSPLVLHPPSLELLTLLDFDTCSPVVETLPRHPR